MINSKEIKKAALNKLDWKQALQVSTVFVLIYQPYHKIHQYLTL